MQRFIHRILYKRNVRKAEMKCKIFCFIFFLFFTQCFLFSQSDDSLSNNEHAFEEVPLRTVVINSARTTEYKKVNGKKIEKTEKANKEGALLNNEENKTNAEDEKKEVQDIKKEDNTEIEKDEYEIEEIVIFIGNVSVSVSSESSDSTIIADKIIYNKTRSTMEASGNVQYIRKIGDEEAEKFIGEYLLFDIEKLQGVFYKGVIQQASNKKGKDPFSIHTYIAGKDESGVIGFKSSFLTTSKDEDPLWSIRASRLWILPGNEMAFANGVLSIGVVPLFYLPFFYYPADEMLFHPVFGFRDREGYFVQTTTYLFGRSPLSNKEEASSFSNFLQGSDLKKQKLEGLFFKNLNEADDNQDPSYLKVMFDMYSRLGYLLGTEGKFSPTKSYIKELYFSAFFGFSNTIYPINAYGSFYNNWFSPFAPGATKKGELNKSNFFGKIVPFRYSFIFNMSLTKEPFDVVIAFPFISDPFFKRDFMVRGENMNWFNYFLNQENLAIENSFTSEESSYLWKVSGTIKPNFQLLKPWLSYFSFDDISTTLNFYSKTNSHLSTFDSYYSPERKFYYPQSLKPAFKMSISGTLFSTSILEKKTKERDAVELDPIIQEMKNPFLENEEESKQEKEYKKISEMDDEKLKEKIKDIENGIYKSLTDSMLPLYKINEPINYTSYLINNIIKYDLTYRISGQAVYESIFDHTGWEEPKDINWKDFSSKYYQLKGNVALNSDLNIYKGLFNLTNSLIFSSNYQANPYIKDATKRNSLILSNYKANIYSLTSTNTIKLTPFVDFDLFKPINFSWNMNAILFKRKFVGTIASPLWEIEKLQWTKDMITTHSASMILGITFKEYTQSLSLAMNLKPLLSAYSFASSISLPYTNINLSTKYFEKDTGVKRWLWEPLKLSILFSLPFNISISQEYVYNIEDKDHDKWKANISWKYISAYYSMVRTLPYKLNPSTGWQADGTDKKFISEAFDISFSNTSNPFNFYFWKNRIQLQVSLNSSLHFNLVRLTDSYFHFSPKITFRIHEFIDLSFGATSRNDSIIKYFGNAFNLPIPFQGEANLFKDLAYSFFFWDSQKRHLSGFKIKSLNFEMTHNLKDWSMTVSYTIKPTLKTEAGKKVYKFDPVISFFVQWNPINDIKIKAKEENRKFSVEHGEIR